MVVAMPSGRAVRIRFHWRSERPARCDAWCAWAAKRRPRGTSKTSRAASQTSARSDAAPQDVSREIESGSEREHGEETAEHHRAADLIQAVIQLKQPVVNVAEGFDGLGQRDGEDDHRGLRLIISEPGNGADHGQAAERHGGAEAQILAEGSAGGGRRWLARRGDEDW